MNLDTYSHSLMSVLRALGVRPFVADPRRPLTAGPAIDRAFGVFLDIHWGAYFAGIRAANDNEAARVRKEAKSLLSPRAYYQRLVYSLPISDIAYHRSRWDARKDFVGDLFRTTLHVTPLYLGYHYAEVLNYQLIDHHGAFASFDPFGVDCLRFPSYAVEQIGRWAAVAFSRPVTKAAAEAGLAVVRDNITVQDQAATIGRIIGRPVTLIKVPEELKKKKRRKLERRLNARHGDLLPSDSCPDIQSSRTIVPDAWTFADWVEQHEEFDWLRGQLKRNARVAARGQELKALQAARAQTARQVARVQEIAYSLTQSRPASPIIPPMCPSPDLPVIRVHPP